MTYMQYRKFTIQINDFKGLFLGIHEKRGLYNNWRWQNRDTEAQTQTQR